MLFGDQYPARWIALRLLDGDEKLLIKLQEQLHIRQNEVEANELPNSVHS